MAKKKIVITDKEQKILDLKQSMKELASKYEYAGDFMNKWNKSNKEKIQELVIIQNTIICHFSAYHVSFEGKLKIGFKNEKVR